jgi:hypothetical protein
MKGNSSLVLAWFDDIFSKGLSEIPERVELYIRGSNYISVFHDVFVELWERDESARELLVALNDYGKDILYIPDVLKAAVDALRLEVNEGLVLSCRKGSLPDKNFSELDTGLQFRVCVLSLLFSGMKWENVSLDGKGLSPLGFILQYLLTTGSVNSGQELRLCKWLGSDFGEFDDYGVVEDPVYDEVMAGVEDE